MRKKKERPKYNMWQNAVYMIRLAWEKEKNVIIYFVMMALLTVASSLLELYAAPAILQKVEDRVLISDLLLTIVLFSGGLFVVRGVLAYIEQNKDYGRITVRTHLFTRMSEKLCMISYPYMEDQKILDIVEKAYMTMNSNNSATEAIWRTLTEILQSTLGFMIYLFLFYTVDPALTVVT